MKIKLVAIVAIVALLLGVVWFLWPAPTEKKQLEISLSNIESGVSGQKLALVLGEISENYEDESGWSKQTIRGILFREFKKDSDFSLHIHPTTFQLTLPSAKITADVSIIGGSILNPNAAAEYFKVEFFYQKEPDGRWRLQGHTRDQVEK